LFFSNGLTIVESLYWISISMAVTLALISIYLYLSSEYSLINPQNRSKREKLYLIGFSQILLLVLILILLDAAQFIQKMAVAGTLTIFAGGICNLYTKASVHTGVISAFAAAFVITYVLLGTVFYLLCIGVAWSRVRLGRHTVEQVILGIAIPTLTILAVDFIAQSL